MTPKKLGPYLVEGILGKGGMGTVYRGTDPKNGEQVALKVLSPELADDLGFLQRFQEEVETLLELRHPNIVQLLSFGRQEDQFYFAMELVEGKSLYAMQKAGYQFTPAEVVGIAIDVCEGLRHSHNLGVVHRDLKPGNIIRSDAGEIKLADYGIAKRFGGAQMTGSGVMGTAEFMSPEQATGKPATIQSDLYSLGAVIFSLISGRPPFEESSPYKTLERVVKDQPPILSHLVTGVPDELSQIVDKLLRKKPEERFRSAQSVQTKLRETLQAMHQRAEMETSIISSADEDFTTDADPQATLREQLRVSAADQTLVEGAANNDPLATLAEQRPGIKSPPKVAPDAATLQEGATAAAGLSSGNRVIRESDFHERAVFTEHNEEGTEAPSNIVTILLGVGFVGVLLASSFLVWDRVIRNRTADELLQRIEPFEDHPPSALQDIQTFLTLYPEHEKAEELRTMQDLARAMNYRKKLSLSLGLGQHLSDVEKSFLKFTNPEFGNEFERGFRLQSMITYQRLAPEIDERTEECLEAAKVYCQHYQDVSVGQYQKQREEIQHRIDLAQQLENDGDTNEASNIRAALIVLFGDRPWASDLIDPIRPTVTSGD